MMTRLLCFLCWCLICVGVSGQLFADTPGSSADEIDATVWNLESPPGPAGRQAIDVTEGTWQNVDVSPDGQHVVFDLLGDLYVMPIEGADGTRATGKKSPTKLTTGVAWDMQPRFSPDGKFVAFTSDRTGKNKKAGDNIWFIGIDGGGLTQVTNESYRLLSGPCWSPDGNYLVARKHFSSRRSLGSGEMWMYHRNALAMSATSGVQLTEKPNEQKDVNEPAFSPDGKFLYFSQDATPGNTFEYDKDSHQGIYVIKRLELETGEIETLISGPGGACRPVPSPDGKSIAFVRRVGAKTGLHVYDLKSGAVRLISDQLERDMQEAWAIHGVYSTFAWTPDGDAIVIWAKGKIRRLTVESGASAEIPYRIVDHRATRKPVRFPVKVAEDKFDVKMLRWVVTSPDNSRVAYQTLGHIYVRDLPDGKPRRLTDQTDHFEFYPSFSRDGRYLVYTTWNDATFGSVRIASVDTDAPESWIVTSDPGHYINPVLSPDGQTVVYEKRSGGYLTSPLWSRDQGMYQIAARGQSEAHRISRRGASPQFASSNTRVFFIDSDSQKDADNRKLQSVNLDGSEQRTHYTSKWATDFRVSPDGQWIAFVERFNVYLAPLVHAGSAITVGPTASGIPVRRVSDRAGDFVHFSGDSRRLHWSLGPDYFSTDVASAFDSESTAESTDEVDDLPESESKKSSTAESIAIGFSHPTDRPSGVVAIVDAKVVTMGPSGVIERGVVVIENDRITAVGRVGKVKIPKDAFVIKGKGRVVTPGFVDTHAHGPMASAGLTPQQNWVNLARLAFGVTTIHDPSNDTHSIFSSSELAKAGMITSPRTFSTGKILYGATGSFRAEINSLDDARFHLSRMKAVGAFSVKSYNQPRRDQRQQVIAAARELKMMVVPEGGSTFMHNMTMIVDGHTGIEHTLPVQTAYDDVMDLWRGTGVGYTPTLNVAYGGISGEQYWYQIDDLWLHSRLRTFIPPHVLDPRSRRRQKSPLEDYNHIRVAEIAKQVVDDGGLVQAGGHGQLAGICTHWEMWSFVQGGMTPMQSLTCGTLNGAKYLGLDGDLGSIEKGKLADLVIYQSGADPTKNIRHTEKIQSVMIGGRTYQANRMNQFGSSSPREPLYWNTGGGLPSHGFTIGEGVGCSCGRCGP